MTRAAYLALWPYHEERIGAAPRVLVNGERRFHSAVHVGLEALDFIVRDDLASSREAFIDHLLKGNLAREDFDVIERARGVEQLVAACAETTERGARTRAAEQLGKDRSWVTNQLVLLELPAELQTMLSAGTLPERDGRTLARYAKENPGLGGSRAVGHLQAEKEAAALAKAEERRQLQTLRAAKGAILLSADNKSEGREPPCRMLPRQTTQTAVCCPRTTNRPTGLYEERPSLRLSVSRSRKALNPQRTPLKPSTALRQRVLRRQPPSFEDGASGLRRECSPVAGDPARAASRRIQRVAPRVVRAAASLRAGAGLGTHPVAT
ncbi:ParB/RepB/Spo0J family partition protein [Streptomyces sp. Root369]|uniref:ParB/RepB/Spo0J family partition protein n=1 Tax=Streptomyces sp. Root369 TaxID=1736523 RepID=UPI000AC7B521|nr:ParB/RepB/Spo0J family partition protein [Streptomyces sp. Root369]